jgi:hypothetical protein
MPKQKLVAVSKLRFDSENPRFYELRELRGATKLSQEDLKKEMMSDKEKREITKLERAIKKSGVKDPIWVVPQQDGTYLVIEGNRRTCVLKTLLEQGVEPPEGVMYDKVQAHVLDEDVTETEMLLQRARLQSGKRDWGAFNEAIVVYDLMYKHSLDEEEVAAELQLKRSDVRARIKHYELFMRFSEHSGVKDPRKFAFFTDAPKAVMEWMEQDDDNLKKYFDLIVPKDGFQKIRSVATSGGLRDFAKILKNPKVLREFLNDEDMTVEDAIDLLKDVDIQQELPFIKNLSSWAGKIIAISDEQAERLSKNKKAVNNLKRLTKACKSILKKMDQDVKI